jgi:hypothetical protein
MSATTRRNRAAARQMAKRLADRKVQAAQQTAADLRRVIIEQERRLIARDDDALRERAAAEILLGAYAMTYGPMKVAEAVAHGLHGTGQPVPSRCRASFNPQAAVYELIGAPDQQRPEVSNGVGLLVMLAGRYVAETPENDDGYANAFALVEALRCGLLGLADPVKLGVIATELATRAAFSMPSGRFPVNPMAVVPAASERTRLLIRAVSMLKPYLRETERREVERLLRT